MRREDILDAAAQMEFSGSDEREFVIRQTALRAASDPRSYKPGGVIMAWLEGLPSYVEAYERNPRDMVVRPRDVRVEIPAYVRGFTRVLIAERLIREQLGEHQ